MKKILSLLAATVLMLVGGAAFAGAQRGWSGTVDPTSGGGNETASGYIQFNSAKTVTHSTTLSDNCPNDGPADGYGIYVRVVINTPVVTSSEPIYRLTSGCGSYNTYGQTNRIVTYQGVARPENNIIMQFGYTDSGSNIPTDQRCFRNTEYLNPPAC